MMKARLLSWHKRVLLGSAVVWVISWASPGFLQGQTHEGVELVQARLLADSETVVPGRPTTLGLHLKMAPGWHTYWEYPGDSGLPTSLDLNLPDGFRGTAIQWPLPKRFVERGGLEAYAYKDEVLLLVRVFPPAELDAPEIVIGGEAAWLVCEEICLPGRAEVSLTMKVADSLQPANTEFFEKFQKQLPQPLLGTGDDEPGVSWERKGSDLLLEVEGPTEWEYDFYPLPSDALVLGHPETLSAEKDGAVVIRIPLTGAPADLARVPGVLVAEESSGERRSWRVPGD